jgi:apolipoprotein N-acyltransferase
MMSTTSPVETARPANAPQGAATTPWLVRLGPLRLSMASAVLLWLAFPPVGLSVTAWIALVPMFLLGNDLRRPRRLYLSAWAGGVLFWLLAISWIQVAEPGPESWLAVGLIALVLGTWWPATLLLTRLAVGRLRVPFLLAAPTVWLALEYLRAYFLSGFPWYYLAHTQYRLLPFIQVSDLAGAWAPSLLVALINALIVMVLCRVTAKQRPPWGQIALVSALMAATFGYGGYRMATSSFRDGPRVALLQSNIKQERKMNDPDSTFATYVRLVRRAVAEGERPDLIVWPETSFPFGYIAIAPGIAEDEFARQVKRIDQELTTAWWRQRDADVKRILHPWADELGVPVLIGTTYYDHRVDRLNKYNGAVLISPGTRDVQVYFKLHLVPFGEYVPLLETFPAICILTPYRDDRIPSLDCGEVPRWIDLDGLRLAVAICFEDTLPQVVRPLMAEAPDDHQPDVLINQTNDGWFYGSSEHEAHLATGIFRAVEHRVPIARAVNTGISAVIDGNGRVLEQLPATQEGILTAMVPLDDRVALYTRWGDWLPILASLATAAILPISLFFPNRALSPNLADLPKTE